MENEPQSWKTGGYCQGRSADANLPSLIWTGRESAIVQLSHSRYRAGGKRFQRKSSAIELRVVRIAEGTTFLLGIQKRPDFLREALRVFDVAEMSAVELDIMRAGNVIGKELAVGGSGGGIVLSGDDEGWSANLAELLPKIKIAKPRATGGVAFGAGSLQNLVDFFYHGRMVHPKGGSEPALDGGSRGVLHSFFENGGDARVPHFGSADFRGGAAEHNFIETLGRIRSKPHADLAAHGESAEVEALELQAIGEGENVSGKLLDGVRAGCHGRFSVAASVGAKNAERLGEFGELRVPHGKIGPERIRKHEDQLIGWTVERVMDLGVIGLEQGHQDAFSPL